MYKWENDAGRHQAEKVEKFGCVCVCVRCASGMLFVV